MCEFKIDKPIYTNINNQTMKLKNLSFVLGLCAALASCSVDNYSDLETAAGISATETVLNLTVSDSYLTKATGVNPADEKKINGVQAFVFGDDGVLEAYQSSQNTSLQIRCTTGPKKLYVFANAPSLADVNDQNALKQKVSRLSDNYSGSFVMVSGQKDINLSADGVNNMNIVVERIAARVEIAKITNAMSSVQHQAKVFKVLAAYLTNVAADAPYDLGAAPVDYYNKLGYQSSEVDALVYDNYSGGIQLNYGASINTSHYLYAYPNPSIDDTSHGTPWSPRCTKLVIKASLDNVVYYYPVVVAVPLVGNHSYKIEEFKITRPGSKDEDTPVTFADCSFTITVSDWSQQNIGPVEI